MSVHKKNNTQVTAMVTMLSIVEGKEWCSTAELEVGDKCRTKEKEGQTEKDQTKTVVWKKNNLSIR